MTLALDATTRVEYDAAATAAARAQVVLAALSGTVNVRVYDGNGTVMGVGTMAAPWASRTNYTLTLGEVTTFEVTTSGTPDASSWYLRFESDTRWLRGSFGPGGDFTWSLGTWTAGQVGIIGTATATVYTESTTADYIAAWTVSGSTLVFGWTIPVGVTQDLGTLPETGGTRTRELSQYAQTAGGTPQYLSVSGPGTVNAATGTLTIPSLVANSYSQVVSLSNAGSGTQSRTFGFNVQAVQTNAVMNTRFGPNVSLDYVSNNWQVLSGTETNTGQVFSSTSPRLWGGTEWEIPQLQTINANSTFSPQIVRGVNGPGGTNNESVLRITPGTGYTGVDQCTYRIYPACTLAQMGMVYLRMKCRFPVASIGIGSGVSGVLCSFKTGRAGEQSSRKIELSAMGDTGLGWLLRVSATNANSSPTTPGVWAGKRTATSQAAVSVLQNDCLHFFKGLYEPYLSAGMAPEHDWRRWATIEFAFRLHGSSGEVAGNASTGWTWVATSLGTTTASAQNGTGTPRFYIAGQNVQTSSSSAGDTPAPLVQSGGSGVLFTFNEYGPLYKTGVGYEIGSIEVYDHWPVDASNHPAEAT